MSSMVHITKADAGYVYRPETQYRCGECIFAKPLDGAKIVPVKETQAACAFFGPATNISPTKGSCIYYTHGHPEDFDIPWIALFTKDQLGYAENKNGFSCKRCEYFAIQANDCRKPVDKDSEGDTPGLIHPNACCDFQTPDKKRGQMETAALLIMIEKSSSSTAKTLEFPRANGVIKKRKRRKASPVDGLRGQG